MHLLHDYKLPYAKLGLLLFFGLFLGYQNCYAQRYVVTLKEALPLMQYDNDSFVKAALFRKKITAEERIEIKNAGFKFIQGLAPFTEIPDFKIRQIIYDPAKKEFEYRGKITDYKEFDPKLDISQGAPVDRWWDADNGKYGPHAETSDGISAHTLSFLKSIIEGARSYPPMEATFKRCADDLEILNLRGLSNRVPSPLQGPFKN